MQVTNDQVEAMIAGLHKFNAQKVLYTYEIEKEGEQFVFEISLERKEEDADE